MVIEWLKVQVDADKREQFVQVDARIWTPALSKYPGFLGKEVWINPENLSELVLVIRWESFEKWYSIPAEELKQIEAEFTQAMGNTRHEIVESAGFQVRKFSEAGE